MASRNPKGRERLAGLATRLKADRSYAPDQRSDSRRFVCPRANAYGGRDGIIPPAVAVQQGLVPARLRESTNAEILANYSRDAADGRSEAERYMDYYGEKAEERERQELALQARQAEQAAQAEQAVRSERTAPQPAVQAQARPAQAYDTTTRPAGAAGETAGRTVGKTPDTAAHDGPGVFFPAPPTGSEAGSLEDFYDALPPAVSRSATVGVGRGAGRKAPSETPRQAAPQAYRPLFQAQPPAARDAGAEALANALSASEAERARLAGEVGRMQAELAGARAEAGRLAARAAELEGRVRELESRPAPEPERHDEVSLTLGAGDERLKVGGDGWECNVLGHVEMGGREVALVVPDAQYGAELLARARPGRMAVLSAAGRTDCEYFGCCGRIYGEAGDRDYITVLRARRA